MRAGGIARAHAVVAAAATTTATASRLHAVAEADGEDRHRRDAERRLVECGVESGVEGHALRRQRARHRAEVEHAAVAAGAVEVRAWGGGG